MAMDKKPKRPASFKTICRFCGRMKRKRQWWWPFVAFQWSCKWASFGMSQVALLDFLEYIGKLSILVAALHYLIEYPATKKQETKAAEDARLSKHYAAWQILNSAQGKEGNTGRADALQDLNRDGVSLERLSLKRAYIGDSIDLTNATMSGADFSEGRFVNINLSGAHLTDAIMGNATFEFVNFSNSVCGGEAWTNSDFGGCNFQGAHFSDLDLCGVGFGDCDFAQAHMYDVNFYLSSSWGMSLDIMRCNFYGISFEQCLISSRIEFYECNFAFDDFKGFRVVDSDYLAPDSKVIPQQRRIFVFCNFYGATNLSPHLLMYIYHSADSIVFTNITSIDEWAAFSVRNNLLMVTNNRLNNAIIAQRRTEDFIYWASNQWMAYYNYRKSPNEWIEWRKLSFTNAP